MIPRLRIDIAREESNVEWPLQGALSFLRNSPLVISQDTRGRCFARDVKWVAVKREKDALRVLQEARNRQQVASTKLNDSSSRSHFAVFIKVIRKVDNKVKVNQMVVLDLAGKLGIPAFVFAGSPRDGAADFLRKNS